MQPADELQTQLTLSRNPNQDNNPKFTPRTGIRTYNRRGDTHLDGTYLTVLDERCLNLSTLNWSNYRAYSSFEESQKDDIPLIVYQLFDETAIKDVEEYVRTATREDLEKDIFSGHSFFTLALMGNRLKALDAIALKDATIFKQFKENVTNRKNISSYIQFLIQEKLDKFKRIGVVDKDNRAKRDLSQRVDHFIKENHIAHVYCHYLDTAYRMTSEDIQLPLRTAASMGYTPILALLICFESKPVPNKNGETLLMVAAQFHQVSTLKFLLQLAPTKGLDINAQRKTDKSSALHLALYEATSHATQSALEQALDKNTSDFFEADMALSEKENAVIEDTHYTDADQVETLSVLLDHNINIHLRKENLQTAIIIAGGYGEIRTLNLLMNKGANLTDIDDNGQDAFMYAITQKRTENAKHISNHPNFDPSRLTRGDNDGFTPLHMATLFNPAMIDFLIIEKHISPNITCGKQLSPLMLAIGYISSPNDLQLNETEKLQRVKRLVHFRADINMGENSLKPICYAANFNYSQIVRFLLDEKADISYDTKKWSIISVAAKGALKEACSIESLKILLTEKRRLLKNIPDGKLDVTRILSQNLSSELKNRINAQKQNVIQWLLASKLYDDTKAFLSDILSKSTANDESYIELDDLFFNACLLLAECLRGSDATLNPDNSLSVAIPQSAGKRTNRVSLTLSMAQLSKILGFIRTQQTQRGQVPSVDEITQYMHSFFQETPENIHSREKIDALRESSETISNKFSQLLLKDIEGIGESAKKLKEDNDAIIRAATSKGTSLKGKFPKVKEKMTKKLEQAKAASKKLTTQYQVFNRELELTRSLFETSARTLDKCDTQIVDILEKEPCTTQNYKHAEELLQQAQQALSASEAQLEKLIITKNDIDVSAEVSQILVAIKTIEASCYKSQKENVTEKKLEAERLEKEKTIIKEQARLAHEREKILLATVEARHQAYLRRRAEKIEEQSKKLITKNTLQKTETDEIDEKESEENRELLFYYRAPKTKTLDNNFQISATIGATEEIAALKAIIVAAKAFRSSVEITSHSIQDLNIERLALLGALGRTLEFVQKLTITPLLDPQKANLIRDFIFHGEEFEPTLVIPDADAEGLHAEEEKLTDEYYRQFNDEFLTMTNELITYVENPDCIKTLECLNTSFFTLIALKAENFRNANHIPPSLDEFNHKITTFSRLVDALRGSSSDPLTLDYACSYLMAKRGSISKDFLSAYQSILSSPEKDILHSYRMAGKAARHEPGYVYAQRNRASMK